MDENQKSEQPQQTQSTDPNPTVSSLDISQDTGIVNRQPFNQQTAPISSNQIEQPPAQKPSKLWKVFVWVLATVNVVILPLMVLRTLLGGIAFSITLALFPLFIPAFSLGDFYFGVANFVLVLDVILATLVLILRKPRTAERSVGVGLVIAACVGLLLLQFVPVIREGKGIPAFFGYDPTVSRKSSTRNVKSEEITKEQAIDMLKTCKLSGFYYNNETDETDRELGGWGELSTTGVVLTYVKGEPYRISVADRLVTGMLPIAKEVQKKCGKPQILP